MNYVHKEYESRMEPKYYINAYRLGAPTSPQTANQIEQFGNLLNQGIKNIELSIIQPEILDTIPTEHLTEIKRLSKLTNANPSLHAPIIEPSGFTQQGWSEQERIRNEKQILHAVQRAHELDPQGNIPVNIHGANVFGAEWEKGLKKEEGREEEAPRVMAVVDESSGKVMQLPYEEKETIKGKEIWHPEKRLMSLNQTEWDNEKLKLFSYQKEVDELAKRRAEKVLEMHSLSSVGAAESELGRVQKDFRFLDAHINELNQHIRSGFDELHNKLIKFKPTEEITPEEKEKKESYDYYMKRVYPEIKANFDNVQRELKVLEEKAKGIRDVNEWIKLNEKRNMLIEKQTENLVKDMGNMPTPEVWKPVNEFAIKKASETLANVAFESFKKFGENAPVITVENSYPQMPLSRGEELRRAIEKTRALFADKLVERERISKERAREIANKLIGATWDIGHINILRAGGYTEEEIVKETEKIAPFVKHLHITDNFGFSDTHLPPGMGNVPVQKMLAKIEQLGISPEKIRGIIEAGGFVKEFKESPFLYALESLGSPLYTMKAPYWAQAREIYSPYMIGYGEMLPEEHFKLYGAGFSGLPRELGGQVGGEKSRFSGTPTA